QRSENGGMAMRSIAMLPCITGSWKEVGGGLQLSTSGGFPLDKAALERPDLMQAGPLGRPARLVNMTELGKVLTSPGSPPVQALFVYCSNPAAIAPNHNDVVRGLRRQDLFTVVHEQFFTDTTDYADVLLPATTFFEHRDLQASYGHYYLQMSEQAITPLGECRSNVELFRDLAQRMGFDDPCFRQSEDEMMDLALASGHSRLAGIDRQRLEAEGHVRLNFSNGQAHDGSAPFLPFAEGRFPTPSGKAELYSDALAAQGLDPVACFISPRESRHTELARKFPLELLARKSDNFLNSSFCNLESLQPLEHPELLEIHAEDAAARSIRDGDRVRVFNQRGEIVLTARVNGAVPRGVVAARLNWAKLTPGGRNINVLTSERLTDIGAAATFYSVLAEVERASA
ncbi:MAG: molybdopterin-dependent oxidoreductase, partial [Acidobacteriota bacterium]|nr:molybdopterin-dependent oxidoreductase [Acidobacteriota bacterium]